MRVTVSVELDDGARIAVPVEVGCSDNPRFWSQGLWKGSDEATRAVGLMIESVYGVVPGLS